MGWNTNILTSRDGTNWVVSGAVITNFLKSVTYGNGQFVAVGGDFDTDGHPVSQVVLTSTDGMIWSPQPTGSTLPLTSIAFGAGFYVAAGVEGMVLVSRDAREWSRQSLGRQQFESVGYGNGTFLIGRPVGILQSDPVIKLTLESRPLRDSSSLILEGPTGRTYNLQASQDLLNWHTLTTVTSTQTVSRLLEVSSSPGPRQFYRLAQ